MMLINQLLMEDAVSSPEFPQIQNPSCRPSSAPGFPQSLPWWSSPGWLHSDPLIRVSVSPRRTAEKSSAGLWLLSRVPASFSSFVPTAGGSKAPAIRAQGRAGHHKIPVWVLEARVRYWGWRELQLCCSCSDPRKPPCSCRDELFLLSLSPTAERVKF